MTTTRFPRLFLLATVLLVATAAARGQNLLLKNAQIVDPTTRKIVRGAIVIRDGVIRDVLRSAPAKFDGEVIDAGGKWVIPGLNDMHVHIWGNPTPNHQIQITGIDGGARMMLYTGVTGFLDLFSDEDQIFEARAQQRAGQIAGADIYCAGPILTCSGGHGTEYGIPTRVINTPEEARLVVDDLAGREPDVIKVVYDHAVARVPTMSRETMESAVRTALTHGIKTVVHIGTWKDAEEAILAGAACITHTYGREEVPADLVALMKRSGTCHMPTLAVETEFGHIARDPKILDSPLLGAVTTQAVLAAYRDTAAYDARSRGWVQWNVQSQASLYRSVKKIAGGGVTMLAGTDVGNLGTFQGFSLHRELELLVAAGLSPWDALASATTNAGAFLGRKFGVRPGDVANLVVLDASPIADIRNTQKVVMVIQHGRPIDRDELLHPPAKAWTKSLVDDFSHDDLTSALGTQWHVDLDTMMGGGSTIIVNESGGMLHMSGRLAPKPGMPGFAGISLPFAEHGAPVDVSAFKGLRLRIRAPKGPVVLKLITSGIGNYDYHAVVIANGEELQTVELPFDGFRQLWSQQVPWTGRDLRALALWATGLEAADYDVTVDSVELY
jgi:imidazolonepropionase-like amidohydrolase